MFNFRSAVFIVSLLALEEVTGMCIKNACARKRAMPFGDPAADVVKRAAPGGLEKRQGGYTWSLDSIPDWAALPYSTCGGVGGSGTTICPVNYYCACQYAGYKRCMPTSAPPDTAPATCSVYGGGTDYAQCEFTWSTTLSTHAWGQCGGYKSASIASPWGIRTVCPDGQHCACSNFWYSQCTPVATPAGCPNASRYWGCGSNGYTSPTAKGDVCGGHCFTVSGVPSACPAGMGCYTQTASSPGFIAICDTASPTAGGQWDPYARSICYPIPFEWNGAGAPLCPGAKQKRGELGFEEEFYMTKPSRVPANSQAEATPAALYSNLYEEATAGQQVTL